MSGASETALGLSRTMLRVCVVWNLAIGVIALSIFVASFVFEDAVTHQFRTRMPELDLAILFPTVRVWLLLCAPFVAAVHLLLSRLLEIVGTVRLGHPFAPENAVRLRIIAWCLLLVQLLHLSSGVMVKIVAAANVQMHWDFSLVGWIAVLLVFVLARVFEEGARIRDDLDAMI